VEGTISEGEPYDSERGDDGVRETSGVRGRTEERLQPEKIQSKIRKNEESSNEGGGTIASTGEQKPDLVFFERKTKSRVVERRGLHSRRKRNLANTPIPRHQKGQKRPTISYLGETSTIPTTQEDPFYDPLS